jgi:hypothetical protein
MYLGISGEPSGFGQVRVQHIGHSRVSVPQAILPARQRQRQKPVSIATVTLALELQYQARPRDAPSPI